MPIKDGILLLNKPEGLTSQQCISRLKRLWNIKAKIGHTGTLDPFATGLLPLCIGEATKISQLFLQERKSYKATLVLGKKTDTGDKCGEVVAEMDIPELTETQITKTLKGFMGKQMQTPPMYSAKKHKGQALYKIARQGKTVPREAVEICIYEIALLNFTQNTIEFEVHSSKGTYVRTLGEAIAEKLNSCGHLSHLERISVGDMLLDNSYKFEDIKSLDLSTNSLFDVFDLWLKNWHKIILEDEQQISKFKNGMEFEITETAQADDIFVCDTQNIVIGMAVIENNILKPKRVFVYK